MLNFFQQVEEELSPNIDASYDDLALIKLYEDGTYAAYCQDLDFMWRWIIYRDNKVVQEGCSLTQQASKYAVEHVLAFFNVANQTRN